MQQITQRLRAHDSATYSHVENGVTFVKGSGPDHGRVIVIAVEDRYVAGRPTGPDLVWIRCELREGRNGVQNATLLSRLREGVADAADVSDETIWIYLCDIPPVNLMVWGHIMPQLVEGMPQDDTWYESMSDYMQASLRPLT